MNAHEEIQEAVLKLTMEKGPLAGQSMEFKPGFTVRVGRVVRGNNLTIKDSGISSKHLSIEFNYSDGKWVICDLESLNGTFLNADKLDSSCPTALSDCDVIKIGDLTSIKVQIQPLPRASTRQRRNPRGKAAANTTQKDNREAAENCELGLAGTELGNDDNKGKTKRAPLTRARTRAQKAIDNTELQAKSIELENAGLRRTRNSSKEENLNDGTSQVEIAVTEKAESVSVIENADEIGDQRRTRNARGRGRRKLIDLAPTEQPPLKRVTRSTRQRNLQAMHLEEDENTAKMSTHMEEDRQVEGCHGESNPSSAKKDEDEVLGQDEEIQTMEEDRQVEENHTVEEQLNIGEEACHGLPSVNLETLTLGQWLDYVEIHVPKQIIDATEEMISETKKKAEKLQEFMLQQWNAKENQKVSMD